MSNFNRSADHLPTNDSNDTDAMALSMLPNLLLACLRAEAAPTLAAELRQLSPADWQQLARLSHQQHVSPLLYHRLKEHQLTSFVDPAVCQQLQQQHLQNCVRNMRIQHELQKVGGALHQQQIPFIVLKGAYLASAVYPNAALRFMADLDLLVHRTDLPAVIALLQEAGYEPAIPIVLEVHSQTNHHLPPFHHPECAATIEVHWTIASLHRAYTVDIDQLWAQAEEVSLGNLPVHALAPEDLLLHICIHATYHHLFAQDIRALCDIDAILRRYPTLDWHQLITRAQERNWAKGVHVALYLAKHLMDTAIPEETLAALGPAHLSDAILETILAELFADKSESRYLPTNFVNLWEAEEPTERNQLLFKRLFVSPTALAGFYSLSPRSPKLPFYYLVRLKDLFLRHGSNFWELWRGNSSMADQVTRKHQLSSWLERDVDSELERVR